MRDAEPTCSAERFVGREWDERMLERGPKRLSKRAKKGFRGWPVPTVALYGPDYIYGH